MFVVARERGDGCRTARRKLGDVPQALALAAQLVLPSGSESLRVGDERRELVESRARRHCVLCQLLVRTPARLQPTPRPARLAHGVARRRERVERRELVARPPEPALLELAAHREQRLRGGRDVLARCAPPPRVGARPAVGEDPAGEHERLLPLGTQLGELAERLLLGEIELGLDVRLRGGGADRAGVPPRAQQQSDRAGEDRLAGARLPGDRVQAAIELQLGLTDQNEVLDPEPAQHGPHRTEGV